MSRAISLNHGTNMESSTEYMRSLTLNLKLLRFVPLLKLNTVFKIISFISIFFNTVAVNYKINNRLVKIKIVIL